MKLKYFICIFLIVYFPSKLLWDDISYIFELSSWICIIFATCYSFCEIKIEKFFLLFYFAFCGYIVFSGVINNNTERFVRGIYEYIFYISIIFVGFVYYNKINLIEIFKILSYVGFVLAILSFTEYLSGQWILGEIYESNYIQWNRETDIAFRTKVFTRSYLSHGVILGLMALVGYYIYKTKHKLFFAISALSSYLAIFTTQSRGPLVATTIALYFLWSSYNKKYGKIILIILLPIFCFVYFTEFSIGINFLDYYLHRIKSIFDWSGDAGNLGRLFLWVNAIEMWQSNIWTGIGVSATGSWGEGSLTVTESGVLKRLVELGIIGFLLYYGFIITILKKIFSSLRFLSKEKVYETIFCLSCVILVLIDDITLQVTQEIMVSFFMWFFISIACRNAKLFHFRRSLI